MGSEMQPVAFDIETTGFTIDAEVTTLGFELPLGAAVFLNTGRRPVETTQLEQACRERAGRTVRLTAARTEAALLDEVAEFLRTTCAGRDYYLVGYNAEVWNGGFDFAFLRTRFATHQDGWPFTLPYADLMPLFSDRINTQVDEQTEVRDLDGVYEALIGEGHCDPFGDSKAAVAAWETEDFADLLCHNIADIGRTQALAEYAERYVPQSDFNMKNLEPPILKR